MLDLLLEAEDDLIYLFFKQGYFYMKVILLITNANYKQL